MVRKLISFALTLSLSFAIFGCGGGSDSSTPVPTPPTITTTSLTSGTIGSDYNQTLSATGGATPYTWSLAGGNLPDGLSLSPAGDITGTPTSTGTFNFTARCTGSDDLYDEQALSIGINLVITSISEVGTIDTGDASDLVVNGNYLYYIGWGNTSSSFGIIDFSDPANPTVLSTLDAGSAYGVAFDGRYAYVETDGGGSGIFTNGTVGVIDCQDPNNPVEVVENDLGYYSAFDMEISGNYLYNFSWNIIGVYDISDPTNLAHVVNVPASSAVFGKIVGDYLYLGSYYNGLEIYDISNPAGLTGSTTPVGTLAIPGTPGYAAAASGTTAFVASSDAGVYSIHSVDVSDPANPVLIGSVETSTFIEYEMRVLGNYLLASGKNEFVVIDISNPTAMTVVDSVPLTNYGWGFDVSGRYAIVGDKTLFRIIQLY